MQKMSDPEKRMDRYDAVINEWLRANKKSADGWTGKGDTTSRDGIKHADILRNIELIEKCALLIDPTVLDYVIDDKLIIPADMRYSYRKFFWNCQKYGKNVIFAPPIIER